jgi:DNA-binding PadR family transcriptional regulator
MALAGGLPETGRGLPRTFQRSCLLLALAQGQSHGYELLDAVRHMGLRSAEAGGLYRCLRTMEEDGLVTSWWEPSQAGPPRRTYELTSSGTAAMRVALEGLVEVRQLLSAMLERCDDLLGCAGP